MALISLVTGFIVGVLAVVVVEAVCVLYLLRRLMSKLTGSPSQSVHQDSGPGDQIDPHQSLSSIYKRQGMVWVLEPEKVPKIPVPGERNRRKEILEVSPVQKFAKIKDRSLILMESDGSRRIITLKSCNIVAVSATSLPSKKWAKRYPIKVESKTLELYNRSKILYIYLETSSEKESWCKALRLASCDDKERLNWFSMLNEEFHNYLRSLTEGHPSLVKPSMGGYMGSPSTASANDVPSSKVHTFWRKLSKKTSKNSVESKSTSACLSNHEERRIIKKSHPFQNGSKGKIPNSSAEDSVISTPSERQSHASEIADSDADETVVVDEGTLCWNLLLSRLFFDAKSSMDIRTSLKARIQRSLSNMRIPSYIGEMTCTDLDPGNLPPYIHAMRAVPTDMNDVWAVEMDIEYSGGMVIYIKARLEVGELDSQNGTVHPNVESSSDGEVTKALLEGFEHLEQELKLSGTAFDSTEQMDIGDTKVDRIKSFNSSGCPATTESRWKSILNSIAKQVKQVPFTLAIRVASLKGTLRLHVKPPPSDQLWVGFTSMPDIDFHLEPFVGEHKVMSARIANFLVNRFKARIQESLVLPNTDSVCIPWMLAEKDDWAPRNVAPFIWLNREVPTDPATIVESGADHQANKQPKKQKKPDSVEHQSESTLGSLPNDQEVEEKGECQSPSRYVSLTEERSNAGEEDDGRHKRTGGRARMRELGRKMGEKLEEKRRHLEEKGRHIVEKMRPPSTSS
ncbi:hypothetical protein Nepgr_023825 [Nepenthes gracilis]|uniref:SMP-LTD domain-containing protein n=1 Tax=Nepenthes gracilis TaxID=150966 RepID=A0AAD3T3C4_NEPGR|nr:hypothetical protein Nepgr_023825 [Nepenthes gracilis]